MMKVMETEIPDHPTDIVLGWSCLIRSSIYDYYSYTPDQLVYGTNPSLPIVPSEGLPALGNKMRANVLNRHAEALQAARRGLSTMETMERTKRDPKRRTRNAVERMVELENNHYSQGMGTR